MSKTYFELVYPNYREKLTKEEVGIVKTAINSGKDYVDLVRGKERVKLNLRNFIKISE